MWHRVFGTGDGRIDPAALLEHVHGQGFEVEGHFKGDAAGWFHADFIYAEADARLELDRYLAAEEGMRAQLNTWAAWLETAIPDQPRWLQHLVSTTQVFTVHAVGEDVDEEAVEELGLALCKYLARETMGVYQLDGRGFFSADGSLIAAEAE